MSNWVGRSCPIWIYFKLDVFLLKNLFKPRERTAEQEKYKRLYMVWAKFGPHSKKVEIFYGK
jgi:hypothetical protein